MNISASLLVVDNELEGLPYLRGLQNTCLLNISHFYLVSRAQLLSNVNIPVVTSLNLRTQSNYFTSIS